MEDGQKPKVVSMRIGFRYYYNEKQTSRSTTAILYSKLDNGVSTPIARAEARCSKNDKFCKATGRKLALTRLLKILFPSDRASRKEVWQKYLQHEKLELSARRE